MAKDDITWTRRSPEGEKSEMCARRVGDQWEFFTRGRRYERWLAVANPPLEDCLTLLDAVRRRIGRRLLRPVELHRLEEVIRTRFPEAEF